MNDFAWLGPALIFGLIAVRLGLPPMIGYLAGGFLLNLYVDGPSLKLAGIGNLGVTLLLFTIGLKLDVKSLMKPVIYLGTTFHTLATVLFFGLGIFLTSFTGLSLFADLNFASSVLIAFALSFSSTVFAVKTLEEKGELCSRHGQVAINVLVMQDIFAIIFLALSTGKVPSPWAALLLLLFPLRKVLHKFVSSVGHGELMIILGLALAFGSWSLFEILGVKGDLGALIVGALIASHPLSNLMAKKLLGFKELLLVGFFLSIGMSGTITLSTVLIALFIALLVILKAALFFYLFTKFKLRSRTAVLSTLNLANYSEFGLIVAAIALNKKWLTGDWVVIIALALSLTFIMAAPLNNHARAIYARYRDRFDPHQSPEILEEDSALTSPSTEIVIIGMASIGTGVYDILSEKYGPIIAGFDSSADVVAEHKAEGRVVSQTDATDEQFWHRLAQGNVRKLILAMHDHETNLAVTRLSSELKCQRFAVADYDLQAEELEAAGLDKVWSLKSQAGMIYAADLLEYNAGKYTPAT
ncbi:cation:proton antiporter domain-containing protein [Rubritalea sp.]|uniref:cation:proton antiporter domain-containing protein n=1 Tax=Rubritalea sp. TaxID=2109375 RepID=UPI003EF30DA5